MGKQGHKARNAVGKNARSLSDDWYANDRKIAASLPEERDSENIDYCSCGRFVYKS